MVAIKALRNSELGTEEAIKELSNLKILRDAQQKNKDTQRWDLNYLFNSFYDKLLLMHLIRY